MRVTEKMLFQSLNRNVGKAQTRAFEAQRKAQTGVRVDRFSDDPVAAAEGRVHRARLQQFEAMGNASRTAQHQLMTAESALGEADSIFNRLREIGVQAATDTVTADERAVLGQEVSALRESLLGTANTRAGNVYVFSGFRTDTQPFLADGSYVGDSGSRDVEVSPGVRVKANVPGDQVFGASGGQDVFAVLDALGTALAADDADAVHGLLGDLADVQEQVAYARTQLGLEAGRTIAAEDTRATGEELLVEALQNAVAVDTVRAYSDVVEAQTALQAAMAQATRVLSGLAQAPVL